MIPMLLMSVVGLGVLLSTFGQIVYGCLFYIRVSSPLYVSYAGTTLAGETMGMIICMIFGLIFMIASISTNQVLILMCFALTSQLIGGVLSILIALDTAPESRSRHLALIEANYSQLDTTAFEREYSCSSIRSNGCVTNCCDESLEEWLSQIYTIFQFTLEQDPPWLLLWSSVWFTMLAILLPSVVGMVAKRRDNEKKFKKNW